MRGAVIIQILRYWALLAIGVLLAAHIVPGISYANAGSLVAVVILLSLLNIFIKPVLLFFTLPFIVLTLGIGIFLINALLFMLAGALVGGFEVAGFGSAFLGGVIVSVVGFLLNHFLGGGPPPGGGRTAPGRPGEPGRPGGKRRPVSDDDDIIDI